MLHLGYLVVFMVINGLLVVINLRVGYVRPSRQGPGCVAPS
jgi:hypothetical protein